MNIGVFAGSFDPFTKGHANTVIKASHCFDKVIIAIGTNPKKKSLFSLEEKQNIISDYIFGMNVNASLKVDTFDGLLVKYCVQLKSSGDKVSIIRGLRAMSDFENEMAIASANESIDANVPTVFIPGSPQYSFVSSSAAKELAMHDEYVAFHALSEKYVNKKTADLLIKKLKVK